MHQQQLQHTPGYAQLIQQMDATLLNAPNMARGGLLTVPIVVHIIHNNGPENITDAQVQTGINHLNQIFAAANPQGLNTNIQFCLAKQNPDGGYTTGINRVVSPLTNMTCETQDLELKELIRWDPTRYINIWLVNEITSLNMGASMAGYAYYPALHGTPIDGIVNEAAIFGSSLNGSKVHTHEVGHYLGLYHTFEGGCSNANCQTDGDHVCDTPPDNSTSAVQCGNAPNTCNTDDDDLSANNPFRPVANGGLGDQTDMIENYMDYGYQSCQNQFTQGQVDRMYAALSTERASLLQSMGCFNPCTSAVDAHFTANDTVIFPNGVITFTLQNPTPGASYQWTINGAPAAGTNLFLVQQFTQVGPYEVTVTGFNADPSCSTSYSTTVFVLCQAEAGFAFTPAPYAPGATLTATNTSQNANSYTWFLDGVAVSTANNFSQQFNTPGGHNLFLVAGNGTCADTSATQFFTVGNCNLSGLNNHWVFNNLSMDFSNGNPVAGPSPITNTSQESTTGISDPDGNLLFFSDGLQVWDRNQNVMPNGSGLMGNVSATQSALAVPFPGNPNRYYLFTSPAIENNFESGVRYSIIDMTLNGGMGDVLPNAKNVPVRDNVCEKLSGTFHANGHDVWITMSHHSNNTFYTYLLSAQGLSSTPVVSVLNTDEQLGVGAVKFSPDGNKMATGTTGWPRTILLADFNRQTGEFMNVQTISISTANNSQPYSLEFSPDNSKLYLAFYSPHEIWQYDLAAGNLAAIAASKYVVASGNHGQMCRGNNGRIYMSAGQSGKMDYIANPNLAGAACAYTVGTISAGPLGNTAFSIPNMIQGLGQAYVPSVSGKAALCPGEQGTYTVPYLTDDQSVVWAYSGPGTFTPNGASATLSNLNGTGSISITVTGNCGITHDTLHVASVAPQQVSLGNDTSLCGDLYLLPQPSFPQYLWSTGSIASSIMGTSPGTYWVQTKDANGCIDRDTIVLSGSPINPIHLGADTSLCGGNTILLNAGAGYDGYLWQNGSTGQTFTVTQPGTYWVTATDSCGADTDSLTVTLGSVNFNLSHNGASTVCKSALPFTLSAPAGYHAYLWQNGSTNTSITVNAVGVYYVSVTDANGCKGTDTLWVVDCAGMDEYTENPISIYPTPANESITLQFNGTAPVSLSLYNAAGQLVYSQRITGTTTVDMLPFANGVYLAEIRGEKQVWRQKVLVLH